MNKNLAMLFGVFLVVVISGIVYAANEKGVATQTTSETTGEQTTKDMIYGQCVSQNAAIKNTCYSTTKSTLETCKTHAAQDAAKKDAAKQCKQTYKKDKKQCKATFKASKQECKKIKHNFIETLGSALK